MAGVGGGAGGAALTADELARQGCVKACDQIKSNTLTIFDEKKMGLGWKELRAELIDVAKAAGPDFVAALNFQGDIPPVDMTKYDNASVLSDTATGRPELTMPQMRQEALLYTCCVRV